MHLSKRNISVGLIVIAFAIIAIVIYFFRDIQNIGNISITSRAEAYTFVQKNIPQSASIVLSLPKGISKDLAKKNIHFNPQISGHWIENENKDTLIYKPYSQLKKNTYYAVSLQTEKMELNSDFLAINDPKIETILPVAKSEASENSSITIIFNQAMVPLTTLDKQIVQDDLPITISPKTDGVFKWISTRNLQFIPKDSLHGSANYKVIIKRGLKSVDGLSVDGQVHTFTTKHLRYKSMPGTNKMQSIQYNKPINIYFNQLVNLDTTKKYITVTNHKNHKKIPFNISYGTKSYFNENTHKYEDIIDKSIISIVQSKDKYNRDNMWDTDAKYTLQITKAHSINGDIPLKVSYTTIINTTDIISKIYARSDRYNGVEQSFFDPQGELIVTFSEEIDKDATKIHAKHLKSYAYDEICKKDTGGLRYSNKKKCELVPDKRTLILKFDATQFHSGETFDIIFSKIVTTHNLKINDLNIKKTIKIYPKLKVLKTIPANEDLSGSTSVLYICTNSPLMSPEVKKRKEFIGADNDIIFNRWSNSYKVTTRQSTYNKCDPGTYQTVVNYGLHPKTQYKMNLSLRDTFDQSTDNNLTFTTYLPDKNSVKIHNMQHIYNVTQPSKTKLTYGVENLNYVDVHICKVSPEKFLKTITNRERYYSPPNSNCSEIKTDKIYLQKSHWVLKHFQINIADYFNDTLGHYVITLTNPSYIAGRKNKQKYERTYLSVTNIAVAEKKINWRESNSRHKVKQISPSIINQYKNMYWINDIASLNPIIGATVTQYTQHDNGVFTRANDSFSNIKGVALLNTAKNVIGAVIHNINDSAIISEWADKLQSASGANEQIKSYIYTDRPIYKPGQDMFIKGISRVGYDGIYKVMKGVEPYIKIFNSKGKTVFERKLSQTKFGTFNTVFKIPDNAPLGTYRITALNSTAYITVEEFAPSAFKLSLSSDKEEYVAGDNMSINIDAKYFFGAPVSGGVVSYSVTSQDYHFDKYTDEYFNFGKSWYECYSCGYGDTFLYRKSTTLDSNGMATLSEKLDFDTFYKDSDNTNSKIIIVSATVKDDDGRSVSAQKSFIAHRGKLYLGIKSDEWFASTNTDVPIHIKTVGTNGVEVAKKNITLEINKITWKTFKRKEVDGGFYNRPQEKRTLISKSTIKTDKNGNYVNPISLKSAGRYEISVSTKDSSGNTISALTNIYIYGSGQVSVRPTNNYSLTLKADKKNVKVGDTAEILIQSPFKKAKALISVERGRVFDYSIVDIPGGFYKYTVDIKKEHVPNIFISALLISDNPEIKFGQIRLDVNKDQRELEINVVPNKQNYLPGEKVSLKVTTKNHLGKPVPAEVSIAVADLSVLALKGNPKKNPLVFFYDGIPLTVTTSSNIKNILHELDIPIGTKGGGGATPDDLSKHQRGKFKDTAFWKANVITDSNGNADVSFTLPDNLTTWQIESLGVTKDTSLGVKYNEISTRKDLMIIPIKPRFIIPGDKFSIGAKVFNHTNKDQSLAIEIKSDSLEIKDTSSKKMTIKQGKSETVYFPVVAPDTTPSGVHAFTLSAKNSEYQDTVENTIGITQNNTYETVATAASIKTNTAREFIYIPNDALKNKGGVKISVSATLANFITDTLNSLLSQHHSDNYNIANQLATIATIRNGLNIKGVKKIHISDSIVRDEKVYTVDDFVKMLLTHIYNSQHIDGGFSYYNEEKSYPEVTRNVMTALTLLEKSGIDINKNIIRNASDYLYDKYIIHPDSYYTNKTFRDDLVLTIYALQDAGRLSALQSEHVKRKVVQIARNKKIINDSISSKSLAYLSIITAGDYPEDIKNSIFNTLKNRIEIDGRGAYLGTGTMDKHIRRGEVISNTGLLLKTISIHRDDSKLTDKIFRWLLSSKSEDGTWGSSDSTRTIIDAMTTYLNWRKELDSNFSLNITLEKKGILHTEFNKDNILDTYSKFLSIDIFRREQMQKVTFIKKNNNNANNNFYYDMTLKYYLPTNLISKRDNGITVSRQLFAMDDTSNKIPLNTAKIGDVLKGRIIITIPKEYDTISINDYIPAGFEIINSSLSTEISKDTIKQMSNRDKTRQQNTSSANNLEKPNKTLTPSFSEIRNDQVFLFAKHLSPGVYEYNYYVRALIPGTYQYLPALAKNMHFPEIFGRSKGNYFTITTK